MSINQYLAVLHAQVYTNESKNKKIALKLSSAFFEPMPSSGSDMVQAFFIAYNCPIGLSVTERFVLRQVFVKIASATKSAYSRSFKGKTSLTLTIVQWHCLFEALCRESSQLVALGYGSLWLEIHRFYCGYVENLIEDVV